MKEKENFELAAKILFFGTLEESFSIESAKKFVQAENKVELLRAVHNFMNKKRNKTTKFVNMTQGSFVFPVGVDLSYWREFKAHCQQDAFSVVLYKWIAGLSNEDICEALRITQGSLYSRYNSGLKSLGDFLVNRQTNLGF